MENFKFNYIDAAVLGAVFGYLFGFIPVIFGIIRKQTLLGILGLFASIIFGILLGPILSLPVISVFIWLIVKKSTPATVVYGKQDAGPGDNSENT
jgi:hypothetical protein